MRLWHGTSLESASRLVRDAALDPLIAEAEHDDSRSLMGFYLAQYESDAAHFAAVRCGRVLCFDLEPAALAQLEAAGAVWQDIRKGPRPPYFQGQELFVPPGVFEVFNQLKEEGLIDVTAR